MNMSRKEVMEIITRREAQSGAEGIRYGDTSRIVTENMARSRQRGSLPGETPVARPRRSKYNVSRADERRCDGILFDSKSEMHHYRDLLLMQKAGTIQYFHLQVPFLLPGGVRYFVDFMVVYPDGRIEYQDVKGARTAVYTLKRKQVEALYPVKIVEIRKRKR